MVLVDSNYELILHTSSPNMFGKTQRESTPLIPIEPSNLQDKNYD